MESAMDSQASPPGWAASPESDLSPQHLYTASVIQNEEDVRSFECLRGMEHSKNVLIEGLFARINTLSDALREELTTHDRDDLKYDLKLRELEKKSQELQLLKAQLNSDCYALVLIDGDGLIFTDSLLTKGEDGGAEAAFKLATAVREHLKLTLPDLSANCKIVARMFANIQGLGQACTAVGIIDAPATLKRFVRGFNGAKHLFDFVDVSIGKDRADSKVEAMFDLHLGNYQCQQIILGISHDNGYARRLEDVSDNPRTSQIYLLEGVPFSKELAKLKSKYQTIKFENLFRDTKINTHDKSRQSSGAHTNQKTNSQSTSSVVSEIELVYSGTTSTYPSPVASPEPFVVVKSANPIPMTWPSMADKAKPRVIPPLPPPKPLAKKVKKDNDQSSGIQRNIKGQRIDPFHPTTEEEWHRIQKLHLCNIHFLRKECIYSKKCTHAHYLSEKNGGNPDGTLTKRDLEILSQVSRYAPCRNGTSCDDPKCIFGHRCPVQENAEYGGYNGGRLSKRGCRHGKGCKFPSGMHHIDLTVVELTKV